MKQAIKIFSLTLLLLLMVTPAFALVPFTDVPVGFPAGWVDNRGQFTAMWGADANNVYAVGDGKNAGETAPLIMYSDGSTWFDDSPLALPSGYTSGQLRSVWGSGTSDIYAVGLGYDTNGQQPLLYHNNGTAWSVQTLPLPGSWTYVQYNVVWGTSASDVYIGGYAYNDPDQILLLFHWNGTNWTDVSPALPGFVYTGQIESIWGSSANDIYAAGWGHDFSFFSQPVVFHFDGNSWTEISPGLPQNWESGSLYEVWGSSSTNVYVAGNGNDTVTGKTLPMILSYDGTQWYTDNPALPSGLEEGRLKSIWGSGANDIYAVGNGYDIQSDVDSPLLYHNDGSGWTEASPALPAGVDNGYLNTVWGSSANDVYAAGQGVTVIGDDQSLLLYHGVLSAPTVSTDSIETLNNRQVNATLSNLGTPASVSAYGVVYNTTGTPTISDSKVDKGAKTSTGAYTIGLSEMSLTPGTKYYVRAFATNATDTSYGAELVVYGTPEDFTHIAPADNATDVSTSPTFSWNASTGATDYKYCVQPLLDDCRSDLFGANWISTSGATYVNLSGLSSSTNYVWAVRAEVGTPASYKWVTGAPFYFTTSAAPSHTVTFNANGGSGSMSPQVSNITAALTSNTFTRSGYTFAGWNTAANGSGTAYANGASYAFTADVTLYAQWTLSTPTFTDVPLTYWAANYIERLSNAGITSGCGAGSYCPDSTVTRAQMAVFLLKGMYGSSYAPPAVGVSTGFGDVATDYWAAAWIKQLAAEGITSGCGAGNYCPDTTVTRTQMAIFLLKAKNGSSYTPPAVGASTGFNDVATDAFGAAYIKQLVADGITAGCGNSNYCPNDSVTRAQMAVFLVRAFNLP